MELIKKTISFSILLIAFSSIAQEEFENNIKVGQTTIEYLDSDRNRPLKTEIWYPTEDSFSDKDLINESESPFLRNATVRNGKIKNGKFPLILLSHGTGGGRLTMEWYAFAMAQQGYIVAAVDHWGNTFDNKIPEQFVQFWNRPLDIKFVLDKLLVDQKFSSKIMKSNISVSGFSLGGYTAVALVGGDISVDELIAHSKTKKGKREFRIPELPNLPKIMEKNSFKEEFIKYKYKLSDSRIKAAVVMAPALGQGFRTEKQFTNIKVPVLIIGAESDFIAPVEMNAEHYHNLIPQSKYVELEGKTGHYVFLNNAKKALKKSASFVFKDHKTVDRKSVHENVVKLAQEFLDKNLEIIVLFDQ